MSCFWQIDCTVYSVHTPGMLQQLRGVHRFCQKRFMKTIPLNNFENSPSCKEFMQVTRFAFQLFRRAEVMKLKPLHHSVHSVQLCRGAATGDTH